MSGLFIFANTGIFLLGSLLLAKGLLGYGYTKPWQIFSGNKKLSKKVSASEKMYLVLFGSFLIVYAISGFISKL